MEAIYERSRVNLKVESCSTLLLRATSNSLPPFYLPVRIYVRTDVIKHAICEIHLYLCVRFYIS